MVMDCAIARNHRHSHSHATTAATAATHLVQQQDLGLANHGAGDGNALLLTT